MTDPDLASLIARAEQWLDQYEERDYETKVPEPPRCGWCLLFLPAHADDCPCGVIRYLLAALSNHGETEQELRRMIERFQSGELLGKHGRQQADRIAELEAQCAHHGETEKRLERERDEMSSAEDHASACLQSVLQMLGQPSYSPSYFIDDKWDWKGVRRAVEVHRTQEQQRIVDLEAQCAHHVETIRELTQNLERERDFARSCLAQAADAKVLRRNDLARAEAAEARCAELEAKVQKSET